MSYDKISWISRIPGYHYYDTPDGEDCLQKVFFMNKMGIVLGICGGTLDVVAGSKPVGIANIAARYAMISLPLMAVGSTYAATCCLLANYRKKDDTYNYFFGGFSAGCVAGACARSGTFGTLAAVTLGSLAYCKKHMNELGLDFFPSSENQPYAWGGIWSVQGHYDFSLIKDKHPHGWKRAEDEA